MRIIVLFACACVLLLPTLGRAEENAGVTLTGARLGIEFNLAPTGNSKVFSVKDEKSDSGEVPQRTVGPDDIQPSHLRSSSEFWVDFGGWAEGWARIHTASEDRPTMDVGGGWPLRSGGGEFSILAPIHGIGIEAMRVGYYHHSIHNFSDARYGDGIFMDSIRVEQEAAVAGSEGLSYRWWTDIIFASDWSPYVFTPDAKELPRSRLENEDMRLGFSLLAEDDAFLWRFRSVLNMTGLEWGDASGLASLENRGSAEFAVAGDLIFGMFMEYNRNLNQRNVFGTHEWQAGIIVAIRSGTSRP